MSTMLAQTGIKALRIQGEVIRCTCTTAEKADPSWHGNSGLPCPGGTTEDLGTLVSWKAGLLPAISRFFKRLFGSAK